MAFSLAISPSNRELSIARNLTRWNFPNIVFKVRSHLVHRGRLIDRVRPAFPRYIFCDPRHEYHSMRERFGIVDFVREGGERIAFVPDYAIKSLRDIADSDDVLPTTEKPGRFNSGDRVLIRGSGVLAGQYAVFQKLVDPEHAIVLIDWMGRMVPLGIDERDLEGETKTETVPRRNRRRRRGRNNRGRQVQPPV